MNDLARNDRAGEGETRLKYLHLLYHEISSEPQDYAYVLDSRAFAEQLDLFTRLRNQIGLQPELTFDDGHRSNYEIALPQLSARGIKAHFFITAGWTGTRSAYMGWNELRALHHAGQRVGAHGWSHALLTHCNAAALHTELHSARSLLQDKLGSSVTTMSLPGGRFNQRVLAACQEAGYTQIYTSVPRAETLPLGVLVGRLNIRRGMGRAWVAKLFDPSSTILRRLGVEARLKATTKAVLGDGIYSSLWALLNRRGPATDGREDTPA